MSAGDNPFLGARYGDVQSEAVSAEDRLGMVAGFDAAQCAAALRVPGLQKTVAQAVQRRLRQLGRVQA